eukprot:1140702-Pelagomonas_calceolata.AAC.2
MDIYSNIAVNDRTRTSRTPMCNLFMLTTSFNTFMATFPGKGVSKWGLAQQDPSFSSMDGDDTLDRWRGLTDSVCSTLALCEDYLLDQTASIKSG